MLLMLFLLSLIPSSAMDNTKILEPVSNTSDNLQPLSWGVDETIVLPVCEWPYIVNTNTDSIFSTLSFTPIEESPLDKKVIDKIKVSSGADHLYELIVNDTIVYERYIDYLKSIGEYKEEWWPIWVSNADMLWFLLYLWIWTDEKFDYKDLSMGKAEIDYLTTLKIFPQLGWINLGNQNKNEKITIFRLQWLDQVKGLSGMSGKIILGTDKDDYQDALLLNELAWVFFREYTLYFKEKRSDMVLNGDIKIPNTIVNDKVLEGVLWPVPSIAQRGDYFSDLVTLSAKPEGRLKHMLQFWLAERVMQNAYSYYPEWTEVAEWMAVQYIYDASPTYCLTIHTNGKFLFSSEFLEKIPYEEWTLRDYYNRVVEEEGKKIYDTQGQMTYPWDIIDTLYTQITQNTNALCILKNYASIQLRQLEGYLNSLVD